MSYIHDQTSLQIQENLETYLRDVSLASASASDIPFLIASCKSGMCFSKEYRDQV